MRVVVTEMLGDFEVVMDKEPVGLKVPVTELVGHPEGLKLPVPEVVNQLVDNVGFTELAESPFAVQCSRCLSLQASPQCTRSHLSSSMETTKRAPNKSKPMS